jgi:hypothetical protein
MLLGFGGRPAENAIAALSGRGHAVRKDRAFSDPRRTT